MVETMLSGIYLSLSLFLSSFFLSSFLSLPHLSIARRRGTDGKVREVEREVERDAKHVPYSL